MVVFDENIPKSPLLYFSLSSSYFLKSHTFVRTHFCNNLNSVNFPWPEEGSAQTLIQNVDHQLTFKPISRWFLISIFQKKTWILSDFSVNYLKDTCLNVEQKLTPWVHKCLEVFKTPPTFVSAHFLQKLASGDFSVPNNF